MKEGEWEDKLEGNRKGKKELWFQGCIPNRLVSGRSEEDSRSMFPGAKTEVDALFQSRFNFLCWFEPL